ncbi:condensation domain-containing protein [Nonomuraea sp. NPDC050663]|uniref:condensation domain-containing protein n=1 Tax=Nonomuraea sp. NPDC050663 TaxID=3364370 RepID=UPI00378ADD6B
MSSDDIRVAVLEECASVLPAPPAPDLTFVMAGGTSLGAMDVARRLRVRSGREVRAGDLLGSLTLAELAAEITDRAVTGTAAPSWAGLDRSRLHPTQLGIWLDDGGDDPARYIEPFCFELSGQLDEERLARAVESASARHRICSAAVECGAGQIPQLVLGAHRITLRVHDGPPGGVVSQPFDLAADPLLRCELFRLSHRRWLLFLVWHHLIADTWTVRLFLDAVAAAYGGRRLPEPAPPTYCDLAERAAEEFSDAQVRVRAKEVAAGLAGAIPLTGDLDAQRPYAAHAGFGAEQVARIRALTRSLRVTPAVGWLAVAQSALRRVTGVDDLLMAVTADGRASPETQDVAGCMVNPQLVRGLSGESDCRAAILACRTALDVARQSEDVPFGAVVRELLSGSRRRPPRFPGVFIGFDEKLRFRLGPGVAAVRRGVPLQRAKYDRTVVFEENADGSVECIVECVTPAGSEDVAGTLLEAVRAEAGRFAAAGQIAT